MQVRIGKPKNGRTDLVFIPHRSRVLPVIMLRGVPLVDVRSRTLAELERIGQDVPADRVP
jgi:hypothetical protein